MFHKNFQNPLIFSLEENYLFIEKMFAWKLEEKICILAFPEVKYKQPRPGFELLSPILFPTVIIVTLSVSLRFYFKVQGNSMFYF